MTEKLEVTFLGTGTSHGVPVIGCRCAVCRSEDPRDKRFRSSVLLRHGGKAFVIDTGPDFRSQCLRAGLGHLDAVIYTHSHTDHIMGFDDLRRFCDTEAGTIRIYASAQTMTDLERVYHFAFNGFKNVPGYVRPEPVVVSGPFEYAGLEIEPFELPHGSCTTLGYVFSRGGRKLFGYFSDAADMPPAAVEGARGVEVLVLDGLRLRPHPTHMHVGRAVEAAKEAGAKRVFLTHICHELPHEETERSLPEGVRLAYDGLVLEI